MIMFSHVGKSQLLVENGGKYNFKHSWAMRFWNRHNLVSRAVTTKMRILPSNFDVLGKRFSLKLKKKRFSLEKIN